MTGAGLTCPGSRHLGASARATGTGEEPIQALITSYKLQSILHGDESSKKPLRKVPVSVLVNRTQP